MNAFCSRRATILPSGNLLRRSDSSSSARNSWSERVLAREQRALLTRWSSVLHSKTSLPLGAPLICNPLGPCAGRRSVDPLIICYRRDDLSSGNLYKSRELILWNLGSLKRIGTQIY